MHPQHAPPPWLTLFTRSRITITPQDAHNQPWTVNEDTERSVRPQDRVQHLPLRLPSFQWQPTLKGRCQGKSKEWHLGGGGRGKGGGIGAEGKIKLGNSKEVGEEKIRIRAAREGERESSR